MLRVAVVAEQSNHRLLRCSSVKFLSSIQGFAPVRVTKTFINSFPAISVSHEMMKFIALQKTLDFFQNYVIQMV